MPVTRQNISGNAATATKLTASNNGTAPHHAARAWVNFNGTGTVAIRGSGNVSSITDNGQGTWTVNLTTALPDANAAVQVTADGNTIASTTNIAASSVDVACASRIDTAGLVDSAVMSVSIFR